MKRYRVLAVGAMLFLVVVLVAAPLFGETKYIDPPGLRGNPGHEKNRHTYEMYEKIVSCGNSGNTNIIDPIHICGWR